MQGFGARHTTAADPALPFFIDRQAEAYAAEIDQFIGDSATPLASFADDMDAQRLADAALERLHTSVSVRLDEAGRRPR